MGYSDIVFWCVRPQDAEPAARALKSLESSSASPRGKKICLVWILTPDAPAAPHSFGTVRADRPRLQDLLRAGKAESKARCSEQGVERIVHYLRGVQIGLALGGGAARGMAHLGVLKSLEQHGIYVDMLAGTSAGAMVGTLYASGLDPAYSTRCFKEDLLPSWFFRLLPGGGYWYLLYKYRFHQFGPMLRKYLGHLRMEQLVIPVTTIAVDLVDAVQLARDTGDATQNILESINLPPLALPLLQAEQAVVDGGLLNNVPANALVAKGCNFVIASTVTASLEKDFMGVRSKKKSRGVSKFLSSIQVMSASKHNSKPQHERGGSRAGGFLSSHPTLRRSTSPSSRVPMKWP